MNNRRTVTALNGAAFLLMFGVGMITPLLPGKIFNYTQSAIHVGGLAAAFAISYVLVQVPMGILADRYGFKHFIVFGYIFCGIAGGFYLFAESSNTVLVGRVLHGLGEAPIWALAPALLYLINNRGKGKLLGWYNGSIHIGLAVGSVLGFLVDGLIAEGNVFTLYIVLCCISAVLVTCGVSGTSCGYRSREEGIFFSKDRQKTELLKKANVLTVLSGISLYGIGYGTFLTVLPNYINHLGDTGVNASGLTFIMFYLGISTAQFAGGPFVDRSGKVLPMAGGLALYSAAMCTFSSFSLIACLAVLFLASCGLGLFLIGSLAYLHEQVGSTSRGYVSGLYYLFWGSGYFLGPIIMGYAGQHNFYEQGFKALGMIGFGICSAILLSEKRIRGKRVQQSGMPM